MRYVKKFRLVETRWDGSQEVMEFDRSEDADEAMALNESVYSVFLPQYRSDYKIEEVYVLEDDSDWYRREVMGYSKDEWV